MKRVMFECLFRYGLPASDALKSALQALGVDLGALAEEYPLEIWWQALEAARQVHYPNLTPDDADRELGRRFVAGYGKTLIGAIVMGELTRLDPERVIDRFPRFMGMGRDGMKAEVERLPEGQGRRVYWGGPSPRPYFLVGCLLEAIQGSGVVAEVVMVRIDGDSSQFDFRW